MISSTRMLVSLVLAVGVLGCGELTEPEAYSISSSTSVPTNDETDDAAIGSGVQFERPATEFVPSPSPGFVPTLLVSADFQILDVDGEVSAELEALAGVPAVRVVDDLVGGLVLQDGDGAILYRRADGTTEVLVEPGDGTLLDVGFWGGSPRAFVQTGPATIDWIDLVSVQPGQHERQTHIVLAENEQIVAFSASRDLQVVIIQDDNCGQIRFFDSSGQEQVLDSLPRPECTFTNFPSFGAVALSPDAGALAYTVVTYETDGSVQATELFTRELTGDNRVVYFERKIGEGRAEVSSLTFDGNRVAFVRSIDEQPDAVVLLDIDGSGSSEVAVDLLGLVDAQSAAFTRVPLDATL